MSGSVPWGLALRWTSVGCHGRHPLEIWGVKKAGLDQGGVGPRAGSTKPSHGGEGMLTCRLERRRHEPFMKFYFFLPVSLRHLCPPEEAVDFGICAFVYGT